MSQKNAIYRFVKTQVSVTEHENVLSTDYKVFSSRGINYHINKNGSPLYVGHTVYQNPYFFFKEKNNYLFYDDEDRLKKVYGNRLCSVTINRKTIIVEQTKNGFTFSLYYFTKKRGAGKNYFSKNYKRSHLNVNINTGNFYVINSYKSGKIKENQIQSNVFNKVNTLLLSGSEAFFGYNYNDDFGVEKSYIKAINLFFEKIGIEKQQITHTSDFKKLFMDWFIKKNDLKVPDNPYNLLCNHYPTKKLLKKNNNNLVKSIMSMLDLKGKFYVKLLNSNQSILIQSLIIYKNWFGDRRVKDLDKKVFISNNTSNDIYYGHNKYVVDNEKNRDLPEVSNDIITKLINMLNGPDMPFISPLLVIDHIKMYNEIKSFDPNFKLNLNINTRQEFDAKHNELSTMLSDYNRAVRYEYEYNDVMTETLNYQNGDVVSILFNKTEDYVEEGRKQKHCVETYDGNIRSFIVSLRSSDERVTVEFDYNGNLVQARSVCNSDPSEKMKPHVNECVKKVKGLHKNNFLTQPKLITHRNSNYTKSVVNNMTTIYDDLPF